MCSIHFLQIQFTNEFIEISVFYINIFVYFILMTYIMSYLGHQYKIQVDKDLIFSLEGLPSFFLTMTKSINYNLGVPKYINQEYLINYSN